MSIAFMPIKTIWVLKNFSTCSTNLLSLVLFQTISHLRFFTLFHHENLFPQSLQCEDFGVCTCESHLCFFRLSHKKHLFPQSLHDWPFLSFDFSTWASYTCLFRLQTIFAQMWRIWCFYMQITFVLLQAFSPKTFISTIVAQLALISFGISIWASYTCFFRLFLLFHNRFTYL